jgi:hypothetical protein
MKKLMFLSLALIFVFPVMTCAFESQEDFGKWTTYYYQHPEPEKIPSAIIYFSDSPMYKSNATLPMVAFFAALLKNDKALMQKTYEQASADSENSKIMLINILGFVNNAESKPFLEKAKTEWQNPKLQGIITRQLNNPPKDVLEATVDSPLILDMLWATFFAIGNDLPVKKIISAVRLQEEGHGEEIMAGDAANWSLRSNAEQHPKVYEICKQELEKSQGATKQFLTQLITEIDKNPKR